MNLYFHVPIEISIYVYSKLKIIIGRNWMNILYIMMQEMRVEFGPNVSEKKDGLTRFS